MRTPWDNIPVDQFTDWQRDEIELQRLLAMPEEDRPSEAIQAILKRQDEREFEAGLRYLADARSVQAHASEQGSSLRSSAPARPSRS